MDHTVIYAMRRYKRMMRTVIECDYCQYQEEVEPGEKGLPVGWYEYRITVNKKTLPVYKIVCSSHDQEKLTEILSVIFTSGV